ncbi:translation initiation factor IF-2-like [Cebus imitator]|uniref:translation initiation factor IF-2-like n=1 Tax=Cebus imitator TaxID=2715852 RepID=UPI001897AC4F|nr:translation initiation factor IF-2-like [Cebus imitator]
MWRGRGRPGPLPARPVPSGARRPFSSSRRGRPAGSGTQWARGPRGRASARLQHRRDVRSARKGSAAGEVPARSDQGAEARGAGNSASHSRRPNKDTGGARLAGREERTQWQVRSSERPGGAIMGGGGVAVRPARKEPPPRRRRPRPRPRRTAGSPRVQRRRCWKARGAKGRAGTQHEGKLGFGSVSFYRVGGAPIRAGARVAGRVGYRGPGPAGRALRRAPLPGSLPAPRPGSSRSASPSSARPSARSLPEPGLIWSRWRQGVGAAQPPLLGCQCRAHSPARPPAHTLTRAPPPLPRDQGSSPNSRPGRRELSAAGAGGLRGGAARVTPFHPQPHAPFIPGEKTAWRRSGFPNPVFFSPGGVDWCIICK